jgi:CheY-like chemotaxis protein
LLVDDRGENRYVLSRILQNAGFSIQQCATGMQGLEMVRTLPDAVILDVKLPDVSGYDVCRAIKTDPLTKRVPVLLISATFVPGQPPPEMASIGAEGYLAPPFLSSEIVEKVRRLLESK